MKYNPLSPITLFRSFITVFILLTGSNFDFSESYFSPPPSPPLHLLPSTPLLLVFFHLLLSKQPISAPSTSDPLHHPLSYAFLNQTQKKDFGAY